MRLRRHFCGALLAAVVLLVPVGTAGAHGWDYVFVSHDLRSNGVQGHGGIVTRYQHQGKYHIYVNMRACWGACRFALTSDGRFYYIGGGTVRIVASNSNHCVTPPYRWYNDGYTCDALTRVVSKPKAKFCWTSAFGYATNADGVVVHSGNWSSNLGSCV